MEKHEWRKKEKAIYLPKTKPDIIDVPSFTFVTISGEGNPNSQAFADCVSALYAISYALKMTLKKMVEKPEGYLDYTIYPFEGVWDINDAAKKQFDGTVNKDDLVFTIMIRQPDFVTESFFLEMSGHTKVKKPHLPIDKLRFETISEGKCIQMLHLGSFDNEPESFREMEAFATDQHFHRVSKVHREIYLSDFRKVATDKLKTVLRFKVV